MIIEILKKILFSFEQSLAQSFSFPPACFFPLHLHMPPQAHILSLSLGPLPPLLRASVLFNAKLACQPGHHCAAPIGLVAREM